MVFFLAIPLVFDRFWRENDYSSFSLCVHVSFVNMPKFKKKCNNPLHEEWSIGEKTDGSKLVSLRARGLGEVLEVCRVLLDERGKETHNVGSNMCSLCLQKCIEMPQFVKHFSFAQCSSLRKKVSLFTWFVQGYNQTFSANGLKLLNSDAITFAQEAGHILGQ